MQRKVTRTGPATLTIALPSSWAKKHSLEPGSIVNIDEQGSKLSISPDVEKSEEHVRIPYNELLIEPMLEKLYLEGTQTITIYSEEKIPKELKKTIKKYMGYQIIEEESNKITITRTLRPSSGNINAMKRRVYRLMQEELENNPIKTNKELEEMLNILSLQERSKEISVIQSMYETFQKIERPLYDDTHATLRKIFKLIYNEKYSFKKIYANQLEEIFSKQEELFIHYLQTSRNLIDVNKAYHCFEELKKLHKEILYKQSVHALSQRTTKSTKQYNIGVCLKNQSNKFWEVEVKESMKETANENKNSEYEFKAPLTSFNIKEQEKILNEYIDQGVDGIILAPIHPQKLAKTIEKINKLNIPLLIVDTDLEIKGAKYNFVGFDNYKGGKLTGEYLKSKIKKGSKVLIIEGHLKGNFSERVTGCINALGKDYKTDVIRGDFLESVAYENTREYLEKNEVDAIFATSDNMAIGAIKASKELKQDIIICGFDKTEQGEAALRQGDLLSTVNTKPRELGVLAIQTMENLLKKKTVSKRLEYGIELVTK